MTTMKEGFPHQGDERRIVFLTLADGGLGTALFTQGVYVLFDGRDRRHVQGEHVRAWRDPDIRPENTERLIKIMGAGL